MPGHTVQNRLLARKSDGGRPRDPRTAGKIGNQMLRQLGARTHDAWFRAKVREALDDPRGAIPHEEVKAHFAKRRAVAIRKEQR